MQSDVRNRKSVYSRLFGIIAYLACAAVGVCAPSHGSTRRNQTAEIIVYGDQGGCPPDDCGLNGTVLASRRFSPLSLDGVSSPRGMAIVDFKDRDDRHLMLEVVDGAFVGVDADSGRVAVEGARLRGSRIIVAHERSYDVRAVEWQLVVEGVGAASSLSDERKQIPAYRISYAPVDAPGARRPLCPDNAMAMVIKGERYDAATLAVMGAAGDDASWFHIACEGHLLWKAKQMSYDPERSLDDPYVTTAAQRRATLAMLAADYCGTGRRFTTAGTPIYWQNRAGSMVTGAYTGQDAEIEAGWDEHGATCLGTPRQPERYDRAEIEAVCARRMPTCTAEILARSEWVTWTPLSRLRPLP
jgi:hypothetical protein